MENSRGTPCLDGATRYNGKPYGSNAWVQKKRLGFKENMSKPIDNQVMPKIYPGYRGHTGTELGIPPPSLM
jgi:hypothetical protein